MAVTATPTILGTDRFQHVGRERVVRRRLTLSGTYDTGGFAITANGLNLSKINWVKFHGPAYNGSTTIAFPIWDRANSKILLYTATGTQFSNGGSTADYYLDVEVGGK
jgi:hypothetical protein